MTAISAVPAGAQTPRPHRVSESSRPTSHRATVEASPLVRKAKFAAVGFTSMLVSFGSLYLFIDILQWHHSVAYAVQTVLAIEVNYVLNNAITWRDRRTGTAWSRWLRFHSMRIGIMVPINQVLFLVLQPLIGTIVANALCIAASTAVNWFVNDRWVFRRPDPSSTNPVSRGGKY